MGVSFKKESQNLFVIDVDGLLTFDDQKEAESRINVEIDGLRSIKLLVLAVGFSGWGKKGDWGDMTFMHEHDPHIEKIAVVANEKWRDQILMFTGAGMRRAEVAFFPSGEEAKARDWLQNEKE